MTPDLVTSADRLPELLPGGNASPHFLEHISGISMGRNLQNKRNQEPIFRTFFRGIFSDIFPKIIRRIHPKVQYNFF
jgi:hypothetical protein